MAVLILKLLTDGLWYLSAMAPVIAASPQAVRAGLLAIPCVYGVWLILNRKKRAFIGNAQDVFLFEVKFLAFVTVFELVILGGDRWQTLCGPFVAAFFLAGILLLRIGRASEQEQRQVRFWALNGVGLLPVMAAALVLSSAAVRNTVLFLVESFYNYLILPILLGGLRLFLCALQALAPLFAKFFPQLTGLSSQMEMAAVNTDANLDFAADIPMETPLFAKIIAIVLGLAAAGIILFLIYRKIANSSLYRESRNAGITERSRVSAAELSEKGGGLFARERNVRHYYRKFLRLCRERGMVLEESMTSQDIERLALRYWQKEDMEELGNLYRLVRYGEGREKKEERQQAKEIYKRLKKNP